ncbi:MAG: hypothetical protein Q4F72_01995 [Desulfovibrionaceae bacterium]|nr:hypothetical protein [Desulfovibrionaceae bacterium]
MRLSALASGLLVCVLLAAQPPAAQAAQATGKPDPGLFTAMVADMDDIARGLAQIQRFKDAGFIYQPTLTVSHFVTPNGGEDWDWRAVVSGMMSADRTQAFFFGTTDDVMREQRALFRVLDGVVPGGPKGRLSAAAIGDLQGAMATESGRRRLAEISTRNLRSLLEESGASERSLRFLGGHLFGVYIERIYVAGIMYLAAVEEGTEDALTGVDVRLASRLRDNLQMLAAKNLLGDAAQSPLRAAVLKKLIGLAGGDGRPNIANLRRAVALCEDVRDDYYTEEGRP